MRAKPTGLDEAWPLDGCGRCLQGRARSSRRSRSRCSPGSS